MTLCHMAACYWGLLNYMLAYHYTDYLQVAMQCTRKVTGAQQAGVAAA